MRTQPAMVPSAQAVTQAVPTTQAGHATLQTEYAKRLAAKMNGSAPAARASTGMQSAPASADVKPASSAVSSASSQVKPKAPTVENIEPATEPVEEAMQKSDMVMPKLEKDGSPASSVELKSEKAVSEVEAAPSEAAPSTVYSKANSTVSETTAGVADDLEDEFESVGAEEAEVYDDAESGVHSDDEGFDTDEYDILDASDEEAMENAQHA